MKRLVDVVLSIVGLVIASPILVPAMIAVYWQDWHSPFYIAPRVGKGEKSFRMVKLRSMKMNADKSGVDSTGSGDPRITAVGRFVRRYKLDEVTQLWNVLKSDMSLVGPRPNVERETRLYTPLEKRLLSVKPGITDIASIVFADEGDILKDKADPDIAYNQLIRPWKSRLGLFYIDHRSTLLDLRLIWLTVVAIVSRQNALAAAHRILVRLGAPDDLARVVLRQEALEPLAPPGQEEIVVSRG